jgi:hypothetical protein
MHLCAPFNRAFLDQLVIIHYSGGLQSSSIYRSRKLGGVFSQIAGLQLNTFRAQRWDVALPIRGLT